MDVGCAENSALTFSQRIRVMAALADEVVITLPPSDALRLARDLEQAQRVTILRVPAEPGWMDWAVWLLMLSCAAVGLVGDLALHLSRVLP